MGQRFTVIEHAQFTVVPVREPGASVGDTAVFSSALYDEANATVVGTVQGFCVRTVVGTRMECSATTILADGMIMTQGPEDEALYNGAEIRFSTTGGFRTARPGSSPFREPFSPAPPSRTPFESCTVIN